MLRRNIGFTLISAFLLICASLVVAGDNQKDSAAAARDACPPVVAQADSASAPIVVAARNQRLCNDCQAKRSRCHSGCDNIKNLQEQSRCVNRCNANYDCVRECS